MPGTNSSSANQYAVVVGMGRTGLSVARHLKKQGWRVAVTDSRLAPPEIESVNAIGPDVIVRTGGFDTSLVAGASCVVASPGVPLNEPIFAAARAQGAEVIGDIELFARVADAPTVGVTGTNGKSTVTTLVGRMAERAGARVRVGGNLGQPALDLLGRGPTDLYVLELSSFQLEATHTLKLKAAVVLNLTPDHMDRYESLAAYAAAKARIFAHCEVAVVNLDSPEVAQMPRAGQRKVTFSLRHDAGADFTVRDVDKAGNPWLCKGDQALLPVSALKISGMHNAANALAALALGEALRLPREAMLEELEEFGGLAHRMQWIADLRGVRYINDSKGTNVGATVAAVAGLPGSLVVIAGGDGKQQDFAPLRAAFSNKVRRVILIGRDADALAAVLTGVCEIARCASLEDAVTDAAVNAKPGETVLLSPACASLDMFRDYAHRGTVFAAAVRGLAA
jgi:UDP-N-acetylmuramoylalanine--D-glutamate ligase